MAEDIIQRLGFDAGDAIKQISTLSTSLDTLNKSLRGVGDGVSTWNAEGKKVSKLFQSINTAATSALKAIDKLKTAQTGLSTGVGAAAVKPVDTTGVQAQLAQVKQLSAVWGKLPAQASAASKQAYQKAAASLASFAATNRVTAAQMAAAFAGNMRKSGAAADGLAARIRALKDAHTKAASSFKTQTQMMTVTWQTLMRVMTTRVILGAISRLAIALREGTGAAIEFGLRIQEIGTIAGKGADLDIIRKKMMELSSATGKGLTDVAEGYYQALSNQVGDAAQTLYVFEKAADLSIATNSSLADSVNLLTAAINGWGLGAESAGEVAGVLFKTIELGRFRVGDLANIIGRIGPMTREMGVSFEEAMSSLTTMTTQGTRANTAITQMRAIMSQMLKPTEKLKKLMRESWGVENAEQAIIKFGGFVGLLEALKAEAGDNAAEMAGLFTNVRALTGVLATTTALKKTAGDLEKLKEAGEDVLDWAVDLVQEAPAKEAEKTFNDLKIAVQELGNVLLPVTIKLTDMVTRLVDNLEKLAVAFGALGLGLLAGKFYALSASTGVAAAASTTLAAAMSAIPIVGLGLAVGALAGLWMTWGDDAEKATKKVLEHVDKLAHGMTNLDAKQRRAQQQALAKQLKGVVSYYSELNKLHNKDVESVKAANKASVAFAKDQLGGLLTTQKQIVKTLEDAQAKAAQTIKKSEANSLKTRQNLNQKFFDWSIEGANDLTKSWAQTNRARDLVSEGMALLRKPGLSTEELQRAQQLIEFGKTQAEQASQSAGSLENAQQKRSMLFRTRKAEVEAANALLRVDQATADLARRQAAEAKAALKDEQKALKNMQEYITTIAEGMSQFNQQGKQKTAVEMAKDTKKAGEAFSKLQAMMKSPEKLKLMSMADMLGIADLGNKLRQQMAKTPRLEAKLFADYDKTKTHLEAASAKAPVHVVAILKAQGFEIEPGTAAGDILQSTAILKKRIQTLQAEYAAVSTHSDKIRASTITIADHLKPWPDELSKSNAFLRPMIQQYIKVSQLASEIAGKEILPGSEEEVQVKTLSQEYKTLLEMIKESKVGPGFLITDADKEIIATLLTNTRREVEQIDAKDPGNQLRQNLEDAKTAAQDIVTITRAVDLGVLDPNTMVSKLMASTSTSLSNAETSMGTMDSRAGNISTDFNNVATQAQNAANALNSIRIPTIQTQAQGGYMKVNRFAAGGFAPQGTDTIPAMLSPGEFVVNARATRRFFSQLVAINAGVQPIYRQEGGPVTNVGDINVSVDGGPSTKQTARGIATALRRELRRKTSTLN